MTSPTSPSAAIHPVLLIGGEITHAQSTIALLKQIQGVQVEFRSIQSMPDLQTALNERQWHIIICDYHADSTISTDALLQWSQKTTPPTPTLFLSGTMTVAEVVDVMRQGVRGVVSPDDEPRFAQMVQQELEAYTQAANAVPVLTSRRDYRDEILDTMQDAIVSSSLPDRKISYTNLAFESIYGYPIGYFLVDRNFFQQVIYPEDMEHTLAAMQTSMREGSVEVDHRIVLPDGRVRWLHRRVWTTYDELGHPSRHNDIATDITERKQAEIALRENQQRLQSLLDNLQDIVWTIDIVKGHVTYLNPVAEKILGKPVSEFYGAANLWFPIVHPDDVDILSTSIQNLGVAGSLAAEFRIIRPDGDVRWIRNRAWVVKNDAGELLRIEGIASDVTDYKQVEAELRERNRVMADVLENSGSVIYLKRRDGVYLEVNREWEIATLLPRQTVIGKTDDDLFPPEIARQFRSNDLQVIETGLPMKVAEVLNTPAGDHYFISIKFPTRDNNGVINGICGMSTDITELKQAELAMRDSETMQKAILGAIPDLMFHLRADGAFVDFHGPSSALAIPPEQIRNLTVQQFFGAIPGTEWIVEQLNHAMQTVPHTKQLITFEYSLPIGESIRQFEARLGPIENTDDIIAIIRDITERKQVEETLRQTQAKQDALLAAIPDLIFHMQADGTYIDVHGPIEKLALPAETIKGKRGQDVLASLPGTETVIERNTAALEAIKTGDAVVTFEYTMPGDKGQSTELEYFEARMAPLGINGEIISIVRDITERKRAEAALRQSEAKQKALLNTIPDIMFHMRLDGTFLDFHGPSGNLLMPLDMILGRTAEEVFTPIPGTQELIDKTKAALDALAVQKQMVTYEYSMQTPTGLEYYEARMTPIGDSDEIISIVRDITERKQAEAALKSANETLEWRVVERTAEVERVKNRLEAIFNHSGDGILLLDILDGIQQANYTFDELFGIKASEYLNHKLSDFFSKEDAYTIDETLQKVAKSHRMSHVEASAVRADGTVMRVELNIAPVNRSQRMVSNLVCIIRDITERKRVEEALRTSEQQLRESRWMLQAILDSIPVRVFWKDRDSVYLGCNNLFAQDAGLDDPRQIVGKRDRDLPWGEDATAAYRSSDLRIIGAEAPTLEYEEVQETASGGAMLVRTNKQPLLDINDQIIGILGVYVDITLLKQAEANLRTALEKEQEVSELRSRFISMASHEFRTPLSVILATTDTLTTYRERMDTVQMDARLDKIRQQVGYMKGIMEDVLQLANMQSGKSRFDPQPGDFAELCRDVVSDYDGQEVHRGRLQCSLPADELVVVYDSRLMRQIISNMVSNALKYSPREKMVRVRLAQESAQIVLQVSDEGIGIPQSDLKHLFEPFHRAENVGKIAGTGLGLSIAREAAELHSGTLQVDSVVNQGTTVTLCFPANLPTRDPNPDE